MSRATLSSSAWKIAVGIFVVNLVWFVAAVTLRMPVLVNPIEVYARLGQVLREGMWTHLVASLWRIVLGLAVSLFLALVTALFMFRFRKVGGIIDAVVYFLYPVPKLALLPVVMLLMGLGDAAKVTMIVLIILFQLIVAIRDSLRQIPRENFLTLTSLGASGFQLLHHLILPSVLPSVLSALRVATGTAISVLFVTETYGTDRGMGYYIVDAWMRVDYPDMYAGIVLLSLTGFLLFLLSDLTERLLTPWRR